MMPVDSIKGKKKKQEQVKKNSVKSTKWIGTYSPDSCCTVYAKNHNLYLFFIEDSVEIQLTTDGVPNYSYAGKNRDTTGKMVTANVEWMADSKHFYVEREDKRGMASLYLVNTLGKGRPTLNEYKFAMPGDEHVQRNELHLFSVEQKKEVELPVEKWKDQTLTVYKAGRPTKNLYFLRKKRTCDEMEFCRVIPETGEVKVVIHEKCEPYFRGVL
ncbi:DPP IV N-terminal domain-containing protein [Butyricimonas sp. An62]|uniref:DPP IV N-terminal domain-containing protein n=2 Tax=Butyricimonas sp. An62 TaxID=1965649 RepID=UPI0030811E07